VRYELYLRPGDDSAAGAPLPWEVVQDALALAGVQTAQGLPAELEASQGRLRLEAFHRPAAAQPPPAAPPAEAPPAALPQPASPPAARPLLDGLNASFPLGLQDAQGDRAVAVVLLTAEQLGWVVFDPQLGRLVTKADHERILSSWRRAYEFHLGVVGAAELGAGAPAPSRPERGTSSAKLKLILWIALGLIVASFIFRACFDSWIERQWNPPVPGQIEPMEPGQAPG